MTQTPIGELLERATADIHPTTDVVAGAFADGRRRRRLGWAKAGAGSLAAAAVVSGALFLAPGNGSGHDGSLVADRSGSSTRSAPYGAQAPSGTRAATHDGADPTGPGGTAPPRLEGPFPVAPDAMAATLGTLLHGTVTHPDNTQYREGAPAQWWQSGAVDLDGASVSVSYEHSSGTRCDGDQARGNTGCTDLGGGFFLSTYSAEITTKDEGRTGARAIGVTYYTPDGYKINATASNAGSADPAHPAMDQPVLDIAALTAIAEDPAWR